MIPRTSFSKFCNDGVVRRKNVEKSKVWLFSLHRSAAPCFPTTSEPKNHVNSSPMVASSTTGSLLEEEVGESLAARTEPVK